MKVDTYAVINLFGKNVQVKKVFWTFFVMMAGLMLGRVVDTVITPQVGGLLQGCEMFPSNYPSSETSGIRGYVP